MKWEDIRDYLTMFVVGATIVAFTYVIANNHSNKEMWEQKCKDGGGVTVTTPNGYMCINPSAIIEVQ